MKTKISSIIAITLIVSGMSTFTSCIGVMEDTADSLVDGIANKIVDKDGTERKLEQQKQERFDNMVNWVVGKVTDQETINKFGYDNCFTVVEVGQNRLGSEDRNPAVDFANMREVRTLYYWEEPGNKKNYGLLVGAVISDKRIASDLLAIFKQLYESKYPINRLVNTISSAPANYIVQENVSFCYCYNEEQPNAVSEAHHLGLAVCLNPKTPITEQDAAVKLFRQYGFEWDGKNTFTKRINN